MHWNCGSLLVLLILGFFLGGPSDAWYHHVIQHPTGLALHSLYKRISVVVIVRSVYYHNRTYSFIKKVSFRSSFIKSHQESSQIMGIAVLVKLCGKLQGWMHDASMGAVKKLWVSTHGS
jgi:hypothetical protein